MTKKLLQTSKFLGFKLKASHKKVDDNITESVQLRGRASETTSGQCGDKWEGACDKPYR
ncbi:MAG: hypothetical protein K2Y08_07315 [Alphaproteobacteria bacterium]|nr:hypothetical protein [Alphaproteobacteria bacterium]